MARLHVIDRLSGAVLRHGPDRLRFFRGGWGDRDRAAGLMASLAPATPIPDLAIAWSPPRRSNGTVTRDGTFPAWLAGLPAPSRTARVRLVEPAGGAARACLLMAAWNEHGYATRERLAARLVEQGVTVAVLENPFYGRRRPGPGQPIQTVEHFALMGRAAVEEGRAILQHLARSHAAVGVSGYSMGGNIGALVGALCPFPVAIAPLAPSHSPGPVYLDGVLRAGIAWDALDGVPDPEAELRTLLTSASVLAHPAPPHTAAAVLVAARADGYIPRHATEALHRHWPGSELRWVGGGHATALWLRKPALIRAIRDAFERLAAP